MKTRWVRLRRTSTSGKTLYLCRSCERVSPTPDKRCTASGVMAPEVIPCQVEELSDGQTDCELWEDRNREKLEPGAYCHLSQHRHSTVEEAEWCKESWQVAQQVLHGKIVDLCDEYLSDPSPGSLDT